MKRLILLITLLATFSLATHAQAAILPEMAAEIADELDAQLAGRLGLQKRPIQGYTMILTTPVSLGNLEMSSPLARLLSEEMATWFVSSGYKVQEIRKGMHVLFAPNRGEFLLTRRSNLLDQKNLNSSLILTGTYTVTSKNVRFNIRVLHAASNEVMAMASATLPLGRESRELLGAGAAMSAFAINPSVSTRISPSDIRY